MAAKKVAKRYVIVRTYSAGVFAGTLESREGKEVVLTNARRLWYWEGAASLSQMAVSGTSKPDKCKFPVEVPRVASGDGPRRCNRAGPADQRVTLAGRFPVMRLRVHRRSGCGRARSRVGSARP